jgi:adenylate cyclase
VDWEAEGLLEDCPDDDARKARRALLAELHEDGVSVEELREAVKQQRLALVPIERILGGDGSYSLADIAQESGVDIAYLQATRRALGLPVPDPDDKVLGEKELEVAKLGVRFREAGFEDEGMLEAARVLGRGMARYAESIRTLGAQAMLEQGADEYELAGRFAESTRQLLPLAGPWLEHVFTLQLRQSLRNEAVTIEEMTTGSLADTREQAVAFADIVGFTELGERVPIEDLSGVASGLSRLAEEVAQPPVQLVKEIGDAVMFVAPQPHHMVDVALTLVERAHSADDLPPLRAGVAYGPAVNRWGDWYGSTVNLASRLTDRARPESVLATEEVREAVGENGFRWSEAGPKRLKGFKTPVKTYRVRRGPAE